MKKPYKIGIIVIAALVLLMIGFSLLLKSFLSEETLKAFLLPRAETLTGRKVDLDQINVSLFKGIVAKGLSVKEKDGQKDFLKTGEFILSYQILPLLKKELVISKIEIISPSLSIRKEKGGKYNFSDFTEKRSRQPEKPSQPSPPAQAESKGLPIAIIADKLVVQDASFTFVDEMKELPDMTGVLNAEFKGSVGREGTPQLEFGRIDLKEIKASLKDMEVKTSGKIEIDPQTVRATLQAIIGKDTLDINVTVKDYLSAPDVVGNLHARNLDLEKLMALGGGKKDQQAAPPRSEERKEQKPAAAGSGPAEKLKASGQIKVDQARFQDYTIKDFGLTYQYAKKMMKVEPLGLQFSGGDAFTMEGTLKGNLQFIGQDTATIKKTLRGKSEAKLGKGKVKQSKIFDTIALITGIPDLKDPQIDEGLFNFDIKEEKVYVDGFIGSSLFKIAPKGWMDFDKTLEIPMELKVAPTLTGRFGKGIASIKFIEDDQGWKVIPLRIGGTTDQPKVSLNEEALKKQIVPGLKRELEKYLRGKKAEESEKSGEKTSPKDLIKGLFGK